MNYLAVIDMQIDFINGSLGSPEAEAILPKVRQKIKDRDDEGYKLIFTRDLHDYDYLRTHEGRMLPIPHCIFGTVGSEIEFSLNAYQSNRQVIEKFKFGTLEWSRYIKADDCDKIEIVGLCTDICVVSNALILRAMFPEADIVVDASCCAGTTPDKHKAALDIMQSCQIEIING